MMVPAACYLLINIYYCCCYDVAWVVISGELILVVGIVDLNVISPWE